MANSEFVQVSALLLPAQQQPFNPNNIAFLTTESPITGVEDFTIHKSLKSVADVYGTAGDTYKMANSIFSQTPNLLTGNGSLTTIPFNGVSATRSSVTTSALNTKISAFKAVPNGKIKFEIDGAIIDINGLDFSNIASVDDIIKVIYKKVSPAQINIIKVGNTIVFSSLRYGVSSTLTITDSTLTGTDLLDAALLDDSTFVDVSGVNATGETLVQACTRILALPVDQQPNFESVVTNLNFELNYADGSYLKNTASYFAGIEKIVVHSYPSTNDTVNALAVKNASYSDFRLVYHKIEEVLEARAGVAGLLFSNNTAFPALSATLNKKQIVGITPCLYLTDTHKTALKSAGVDYYINNLGTPAYVSNGANGGFIDDRYNLKITTLECLVAYDNALTTLTKIPQTQDGINYIAGQIDITLRKLKLNGIIGTGIKWNSNTRPASKPPLEFERIINAEGFFIDIPNITTQSQADREQRKCPPIPVYIQLAGAIHTISSVIYIQR